MGLKTIIFITSVLLTSFIALILVVFHFTIAGALVWDGNVCPDNGYFSRCIQLHSYFAAMALTLIVETLIIALAIPTFVGSLVYHYYCLNDDYVALAATSQSLASPNHPTSNHSTVQHNY